MRNLITIIAITIITSFNIFSNNVSSNANEGQNTLRAAIELAEENDVITFDLTVLLSTSITIDKNITITGTTENAIIDASNNDRIFNIESNATVTLNNITLKNGNVSSDNGFGGAIINNGTLHINNCTIENCTAFNGGAIYTSGYYTINQSQFNNNESTNYGGAIYHKGFSNTTQTQILNTQFIANTATNDGGAIYTDGFGGSSSPIIVNNIFRMNIASDKGGAVYSNGYLGISSPSFLNCTFMENMAETDGNVIYVYGSMGEAHATIENSIVWNNINPENNFGKGSASIKLRYTLTESTDCPSACICEDGMVYGQDPLFTDLNNLALLNPSSPAINSGNNTPIENNNIATDLANCTRIANLTVDMGAFECASVPTTNNLLNTINLTVILEGAYDASTGMMHTLMNDNNLLPTTQPYNAAPYYYEAQESVTEMPTTVVDWVLVEIREAADQTATYKKAALLMNDGSITDLDGITPLGFDLSEMNEIYVVIRHRNHLDIMSQAISVANTITYDFTTTYEMAFGVEQQKLNNNGQAMLLAGDVNNDMTIQTTDSDVWRQNAAVLNSYTNVDFNLDGSAQTTDYDAWYANRSKLAPAELSIH